MQKFSSSTFTAIPVTMQQILQKQIKKVAKAARSVTPEFKTEDIHSFRVSVKKLRAIVHFINSVKGQPDLKMTGKFKTLYRIAGTLRDAHLKYETLTHNNLQLTAYYDNLSAIIARNKQEWCKLNSDKVMDKLHRKLTGEDLIEIVPAMLTRYFKRTVRKIKELNDNQPNDEHIHQMRKLIKDLVYITAVCEKQWKDAEEEVAKIPHTQLIDISNLIGIYNDGSILLDELSAFSSTDMKGEEQKAMTDYINDEMQHHLALRKDLLLQINQFVSTAEHEL